MIFILSLNNFSWAIEKDTVKYVNASLLTLINKAQPDSSFFQRLDERKYSDLTPIVRRYFTYSTGLAIAFQTNSRNISARWETESNKFGVNTTLIAQTGLDLYIRRNGQWVFAGVGTPNYGVNHQSKLVENMNDSLKECLLYLPLFTKVKNLDIGVDKDALLEALPVPFRHKIVVIGSSITHGASAGRPGMAYPARLNRALGFEFPNLGISGQCKLDAFLAHIAADTEADAFVLDVFSNPSPQQIEERLERFVAIIRKKHLDTPLIFLQTEVRDSGVFNEKIRKYEYEKRIAAELGIKKLEQLGYKNIYFVNPGMDLGTDHQATVDGVHPSDLGFERILDKLQPVLVKILHRHKIR
ncbi:hypothetical protein D0T57_10605 [Dysgonomonas sp. 511]|nr:hypothetical protein [Dysgonomonas sp. 511]